MTLESIMFSEISQQRKTNTPYNHLYVEYRKNKWIYREQNGNKDTEN